MCNPFCSEFSVLCNATLEWRCVVNKMSWEIYSNSSHFSSVTIFQCIIITRAEPCLIRFFLAELWACGPRRGTSTGGRTWRRSPGATRAGATPMRTCRRALCLKYRPRMEWRTAVPSPFYSHHQVRVARVCGVRGTN